MFQINNKFNVGEEVFSITQAPLEHICNICDGTGIVNIKDEKIMCPKCKGSRIIESEKYKVWKVIGRKLKVSSIKVSIFDTNNVIIRYSIGGYERHEENVFKTIEEAIKKCKKLNHVLEDNEEE